MLKKAHVNNLLGSGCSKSRDSQGDAIVGKNLKSFCLKKYLEFLYLFVRQFQKMTNFLIGFRSYSITIR
jgi:hypothetical protein